jgi:hypothetical protein
MSILSSPERVSRKARMGICLSQKIDVARVTLERVEGIRARACVTSMQAADVVLKNWSRTAPEFGYDKCDFSIDYEDGQRYVGRFDLTAAPESVIHLADHIRRNLLHITGRKKPANWTKEQYDLSRSKFDASTIQQAAVLLEHYEI